MRGVLIALAVCLLCCSMSGKNKENRLVFAQVACEESVIVGDSAVVGLYVYSPYRIESIKVDDGKLKMSGGRLRRLNTQNRPSQQVTYINGKPYYRVLAAQYVVKAEKKGRSEFPQLKFEATLLQQQTSNWRQSPFYGPFDDFFQTPAYTRLKEKGRSDSKKLEFIDKPARTTEELIKSEGKNVM